MDKIIMHVDLDAFYAACEEQRSPELRGKPIIVGADPKEGKGRGVVSTCNYEVRKFGIHSGMPISWAYKRAPHAIYLPVDMAYYTKISQQIMQLLQKKVKKFEQISIDEAFLDISSLGYEGAEKLAKGMKAEIKKKFGLTCSIGISQNKLIAKIASDFQKPNGLTVVKPHEVKLFLYPLSVRKLIGVGPKTEAALKELGVETIGELAAAQREKLERIFGKFGLLLYEEARGIYEDEVSEDGEIKSISRQATFAEDISEKELILAALNDLINEVLDEAASYRIKFKAIIVKVRYSNFETHTKQKKFKTPLRKEEVKAWAKVLLKSFLKEKRKIRLIGFAVSDLVFSS